MKYPGLCQGYGPAINAATHIKAEVLGPIVVLYYGESPIFFDSGMSKEDIQITKSHTSCTSLTSSFHVVSEQSPSFM